MCLKNQKLKRLIKMKTLDEYLNEQAEVGNTIIKQLGGTNKLQVMLGATVVTKNNGIVLKLAKAAKNKIKQIDITLKNDEYVITLYSGSGLTTKQIGDPENVLVNNLKKFIEDKTGLALTL